jgi:NAD(P)-dependent dehydrogenase (short-subunit alcohol dehydrogenase family)
MARPMPRLAPVIMATLSMNIEGKVALITGSAKRIGKMVAIDLAKRGARTAIHYRSSRSEAEETLKVIRSAGGDGATFQADLADIPAIEKMFRDIRTSFGGLDILVNNASTFRPSTAPQTTAAEWEAEMNANARAPFFVAQQAASLMLARGQGKIINIADVAGEVIWPGYFAYSVSKAALIAVNRGLAKSYAPHIQVNAIAPGPILFPEHYTDEQKKAAIEKTLLKREGNPQDIVNAVVFLIENDYITGDLIHVDGGRHLL